jgi:uncharacterized membrane protein
MNMESKTKLFGHPIHQMLIVLPVGLFIAAVAFDILYLITGNDSFPFISYYNMAGGILGGLLAAVFGFRDWLAIPAATRAKRIGAYHGVLNLTVTTLMAVSWLMRREGMGYDPSTLALILSFMGIILATVAAWFGGELVDRLRVGVDEGANLDAPSSLSGPAVQPVRSETPHRK